MAVNPVALAVEGITHSFILTGNKRLEDSVRAGGNNYLTAICQLLQASQIVYFASRTAQALGSSPLSLSRKTVVYLTPILLAYFKDSALIPQKFRFLLTFCQRHLGTLYQTAAVVSSISLIFFGQTFFAVSSLCILGIGFMDRNGWLPLRGRQFLHQYNQPLLIAGSFVAGGILDRIAATLSILAWCANRHLIQQTNSPKNFTLQNNLTPQQAQDFLQGRLGVGINKEFIHYNPCPPVPSIDIAYFIEEFDKIDWNKHLITLRKKFAQDPRFIERHQSPALKTNEEIISIARESLKTFVDSVKKRRILEGEPTDYTKLHNYLKIIAKYLQDQEDETTRVDIIFRLAVEGGEYCGPGKFEVAESIYTQAVNGDSNIPLGDKIAYCFQDERAHWIQRCYSDVFGQLKNSLVGRVIDYQDVHTYNQFINLHGDELGLRKAAAENDDTAIVDPLSKWLMSHLVGKTIQEDFWNSHGLYKHQEILIDAIGTPQLPKPEIYAFWQQWIARQEIAEEDKQALIAELAEGRLYGEPLEQGGKCTSECITLMLLDMGIAEIVT